MHENGHNKMGVILIALFKVNYKYKNLIVGSFNNELFKENFN